MASSGTKGYGSKLYYGATSGAITTPIGQILDSNAPEEQADDIEITNSDSTAGYKEYIPGLIDGGEYSTEVIYTTAIETTLRSLVAVQKWFKLTLPDNHTYTWYGYVKSLGTSVPVNDAIKSSITIKASGKPVYA